MSTETRLREQICLLAKSMFDRGLTGGSTGNISAQTEDGGLLVSPTGTSFGRLDPGRLSRFDADGILIDGDPPTKEMPPAQRVLRYAQHGRRGGAPAQLPLRRAVADGRCGRRQLPAAAHAIWHHEAGAGQAAAVLHAR